MIEVSVESMVFAIAKLIVHQDNQRALAAIFGNTVTLQKHFIELRQKCECFEICYEYILLAIHTLK